MAKVKQDSAKPKQKKRISAAQLVGREEVQFDLSTKLFLLVAGLILLLLGGTFLFMGMQIPLVDCAAGDRMQIDCGVDYRLFGLVTVARVSIDEAGQSLRFSQWGGKLLGVYAGGILFFIGLQLYANLLMPRRLKAILLPTGLTLFGLGLVYLALLVPTLTCHRPEPSQVNCQEEYRLLGVIKVEEGRLLKGVESASLNQKSETRTEEIKDEDGRDTGRTRRVTYTVFWVQLNGLDWLVFDQSEGRLPWDDYLNQGRTQQIVGRLNNFMDDPEQTDLTVRSVKWVWRIFMLGISFMLLYLNGPFLVRAIFPNGLRLPWLHLLPVRVK